MSVIHLLLRQANSFRIYAENFHPGGLCKWKAQLSALAWLNNSNLNKQHHEINELYSDDFFIALYSMKKN